MSLASRIRVVQMMYTFDIEAGGGGLSRFALELGQKLDPEKFEVIFCSLGYYSTPLGQQWIARLKEQGFWAFEANPKWFEHRSYVRFFRAVENMRKEFSRYPVHILHSHSEYTDVAAILLKPLLRNSAVIRTIHYGYQEEWRHSPLRRALLTNFAYPLMMEKEVGINQAITDRLNQRRVALLLKRKSERIYNAISLERFFLHQPKGTPFASEASRLEPEENSRSAPDDSILAKKAAMGIPEGAPVIGSVGRLTEQKAYHFLLQAAPDVLDAYPEAVFLIVGDGDLEEQLREQARQMGLAQRFIFTGARQDVEELLSFIDLFVSTSLWEGLPTVILEAMACNIPVIASDIPGTNELVHHDQNGWLTPPADPAALALAIKYLLSNPGLRQRLAQNARQTVEGFTMDAVAQKYEELYTKLRGG